MKSEVFFFISIYCLTNNLEQLSQLLLGERLDNYTVSINAHICSWIMKFPMIVNVVFLFFSSPYGYNQQFAPVQAAPVGLEVK